MKLLITGSGRIASNLAWHASRRGSEVVMAYRNARPELAGVNALPCDITDRNHLTQVFAETRPQVVFHTAATTNHSLCEQDHAIAHKVNVEGTLNVAQSALKNSAAMIFISTDNVFDGEKGNYSESDEPNPLCYFGITKFEAENALRKLARDRLLLSIVRTGPIYGLCKGKFPWNTESPTEGMISSQELGKPVTLFADETRSFILVDSLSFALLRIAVQMEQGTQPYPIIHIGGESMTRYAFGLAFASALGLNPSFIRKGTIVDDWKGLAPRPKDCSLDTTIALNTGTLNPQTDKLLVREGFLHVQDVFPKSN